LISKEIGDTEGVGWSFLLLGNLAVTEGDYSSAIKIYEEALDVLRLINNPTHTWVLQALARTLISQGNSKRAIPFVEESMELCQQTGDQNDLLSSFRLLGWASRLQGDYPKAHLLYSKSLKLSHQMCQGGEVAQCFIHMAHLMYVQGFYEKFVIMLGTAEKADPNIREASGPFMRTETGQFVDMARTQLGEEAFNKAWSEGAAMTLEQAIEYALQTEE
jgi:tetratricopeptide (TPR) repeat protein